MIPALLYVSFKKKLFKKPSYKDNYCLLKDRPSNKYLFAFDIDNTLTCRDSKSVIEMVRKRSDCDIALVTARPVWPVDIDIRTVRNINLPSENNVTTCYRPFESRDSVEKVKLDQLLKISKDYDRVFFFDDMYRTINHIDTYLKQNNIDNITTYYIPRCNTFEYVKRITMNLS